MFDKVLIVVGKTFSGKTYFVDKYLKNKGYTQVITHTTRPKRETEDENAYYFETEINQNGLALREYDMIDNHVAYWTTKEDIYNTVNPVIIIDIEGAIEIAKTLGAENVRVVYVNELESVIFKRMTKGERSNENLSESLRRFNDDKKHFEKLDQKFRNLNGYNYMSGEKFLWINR